MKKVIVTGVSGQDGSYMAEYLLERGYEVYGAIREGIVERFLEKPNFYFVYCDLTNEESVQNAIRLIKPDYFLNFAAQSSPTESFNSPIETFDTNTIAVYTILEELRKTAPKCRFFNAGTCEEDSKGNPYAITKNCARKIVKFFREEYNMYALQGTLHNHESERRGADFVTRKISLGVAKIVYALNNGLEVEPFVLGNLDSYRDWSYAPDIIDGIWKMMNQDDYGQSQSIKEYEFCSNQIHSVREFIETAFWLTGVIIKDVNPERLEPTTDFLGDQVNYVLTDGTPVVLVNREFYRPAKLSVGNSDLAREELGWKPKTTFISLVQRMINNDITNLTEQEESA